VRKVRILLADDHETVREGLKAILSVQDDMEVIGEAENGRDAVTHAQSLQPDVVIMDVSMPTLNGMKATESLRQICPSVSVVALTRHADEGYLQQLMRAGASAYVLKQSRSAELLHAVRAVSSGGKYVDPAIANTVVGESNRRPAANVREPHAELTPRETEIIKLLAWGYSNKEIAATLSLSVKTVETHRTNAINKLGLRSRTEIVRYALLKGWLRDS
jgi:DNA-binding NarL/FixJ family response regulator